LLAKFHKFIKPSGSILLDVHSLNTYNNREELITYERNLLDSFWAPEHYHGFLNTFIYDKEKITLDKYTIIEKSRTRIVYNWLQYFSQESLSKEFNENGFEIKEFYSDVAGGALTSTSPDIAIVAKTS
jgi:hypothetical protein